jgi:hypothetical protein
MPRHKCGNITAHTMKAIVENPYFVLALPWDAPRSAIEREAQKWLGMLQLSFAEAMHYSTPLGLHVRTADLVRTAVAQLRDPASKVMAQMWAVHSGDMSAATVQPPLAPPDMPTSSTLALDLGWQPKRRPEPEENQS